MLINVWASVDSTFPDRGPYKLLNTIKKDALYSVGEITHYGEVILIPPPIPPFSDEVDQSVVIKLNPASLSTLPEESVIPKPPKFYNKIEFFPILVDEHGYFSDDPPPTETYTILAAESLTVEDVSSLLTKETFSLWKKDCYVSRDTADALERVTYAIVHRYSLPTDRDSELDLHSSDLINLAVACLGLIRPTRRSRAMNIPGVIRPDGTIRSTRLQRNARACGSSRNPKAVYDSEERHRATECRAAGIPQAV